MKPTWKETEKTKKGIWKILIPVLLLLILAGTAFWAYEHYMIRTVYVEGNAHYTQEEIIDHVMNGTFGKNSLYLRWKYRKKQIEHIPFISAIEVKIESADTIRIVVYEKSFAGYIKYLGRCMYFDKEGTVVESSTTATQGIPEVLGLNFDHVVMYEPLPVQENRVFNMILDLTQSLKKYELLSDKIYFDKDYKVTLYFDKIKIKIGDTTDIDEKFSKIQAILPELEGKSGILQMENYTKDTKTVTFQAEKE